MYTREGSIDRPWPDSTFYRHSCSFNNPTKENTCTTSCVNILMIYIYKNYATFLIGFIFGYIPSKQWHFN